jgi:hypothetical protein
VVCERGDPQPPRRLTPDVRDGLNLYDTTVNNVADPSIYVTYHDAQAYPEYLVKFKQEGVENMRGAYSQSAAPQPQSAAPAPQVPRPSRRSRLGRQMNVVVPPGIQPGQKMSIQAPTGTIVTITVPPNMRPGAMMTVGY